MGNRQPKQSLPSSGHRSPPELAARPSGWLTRSSQMLLLSVLGAVVILIAIVIATPLEELDESLDTAPALAAAADNLAAQPSQSVQMTSEQLGLPNQAAQVDVAKLQAELLELGQRLESQYGDDTRALHIAAQTHAALRRTETAMEIWQRCLALAPKAAGPYVGLAELQIKNGQETAAVKTLELASQQGLQSVELYSQLGLAYENSGELELAHATLREGIQQFPEAAVLLLALGRVENQNAQYAAAEQTLRRLLELEPTNQAGLYALSIALTRQRKQDEAAEVRQRLTEQQQPSQNLEQDFQTDYDTTLVHIARTQLLAAAALFEEKDQLAQAEQLVRRSLELSPQDPQALMLLSRIWRRQSRFVEASALHQELVRVQPDNLLNYVNLASVNLELGDVAAAELALQQALRLDPEGVVAQASLARLYLASNRVEQALPLAELVLQRNRSVESYMLIAQIYAAQGDTQNAERAIVQAHQLDPAHPLLPQLSPGEGQRP